MTKGIYIASTAPRSGKTVVALGLMEMLAPSHRVAIFRPVVRESGSSDQYLQFFRERYAVAEAAERWSGVSEAEAHQAIAHGDAETLMKRILARYKELEGNYDLILCIGTDFEELTSPLEFEFNLRACVNLGCVLLPVVNAHGRSPEEVLEGTQVLLSSCRALGAEVPALFINRVEPALLPAMKAYLRRELSGDILTAVLSEQPMLGIPSVRELAAALGAKIVLGDSGSLDRDVLRIKVAAMELPHFLDHLEDGSLIITPGDRADIIMGTHLVSRSERGARPAGLLLTGGLDPAPQVEKVLRALGPAPIPMLSVTTDTFTTVLNVSAVKPHLVADASRKIAAALGTFEDGVDIQELRERLLQARVQRVTPILFEHELVQRAKRQKQHIVLPEGGEERILRAAEILLLRAVVDLTLLGTEDEIRSQIHKLGLRLEGVKIIDPVRSPLRERFAELYYELRKHKGISRESAWDTMADVSYFGTCMVQNGLADGMVSGSIHTTQHTIRPAFEIIKTQQGCSLVSSVFLMCLADRVLVYGDCAVNPNPDAQQLAEIALSAAQTAEMFGISPRVAMLSYSTGESGKGEDVDKVRQATQLAKQRCPSLEIEGPIQYDAAVDPTVAKLKLPKSTVAGRATVLIFPDLNTGNNTYKAVQRSAGAVAVGPVLQGLKKPVNDLSRGCTVTDIVNTVAITAIQAQASKMREQQDASTCIK
jgi:phosphate acetyltransferase